MATDLEQFVDADGRAERVAEVRRQIDAAGITYIYYQFISVTGRIMGKGVPAPALGVDGPEGLPARVRLDGEPLRRPPRRVHRLRPRGVGAGRHPRARDVHAPAVGPEGRARVVHVLPRPRGSGGRRVVPHLGLPRQPEAHPGRLRVAHRDAPPRGHGARDDVAQDEAGRYARCRGRDQALLLPHRPVLRAPADHPQGHRVRPEDGPRHDPGRPRGRAGPDRAQLHVRPGRAHRRPALDLPPDLQAGRARAERVPVLHAQALHGRLGQRVPHEHLDLEGRREPVHARERRPAAAEQARPPGDRRHPRAPRRADGRHGLDRELLPAPLGHRVLGAGLRRLGIPEPHDRASGLGAGTVRVPRRSTRP